MKRSSLRGAALVEFQIAALLVLLPLLLGVIQVALLICGYHALSFAAAEAARAGSVQHASRVAMLTALGDALHPLHIDLTQVTADGGPIDVVLAARLRATADVLRHAAVERTTPTNTDFEDHGRVLDGRRVLPNDALEHRAASRGRASGRSLQESNLLRIRVRYCHALVVPLIDRMLPALLKGLDADPEHQLCYAVGRVPLRVVSSAPMQSEAWP